MEVDAMASECFSAWPTKTAVPQIATIAVTRAVVALAITVCRMGLSSLGVNDIP
jgi:hypothetical protein